MLCGTDYSKIFNYRAFNSTFNHSIGVALIVWNFTHDKKQTIAGLYHDIATPTFKHCIDFMNGDSEHQESTEERTEEIIKSSKEIMKLLEKDGIKVEEISNYHIYPIADNDTPKLSADRFEYTFSNGLFLYGALDLEKIKYFYDNVTVLKNEEGIEELGFKDVDVCEEYLHTVLPIYSNYDDDNNRTVMQFFADIVKDMNLKGYITIDDLYKLSEREVIDKILNCEDKNIRENFINFQNATEVYGSDNEITDKYCISVKGKRRYVIPLVQSKKGTCRIDQVSEQAEEDLKKYFSAKRHKYTGFNFIYRI